VERWLERIGRKPNADPVLDPYTGYATPDGWVLRGRVLTHLRRTAPRPDQSRWTNLRQMISLFITDEVADVPFMAAGVTCRSDAEGYVTMTIPAQSDRPGWHEVEGRIVGGSSATFAVRALPSQVGTIIISDIDDTMIRTGAHSLARNLWTTFTGSALTRTILPDAKRLMDALGAGGAVPVFYVSSSPWNMNNFLDRLFARHGLPRGPMFLRDLGVSAKGGIGSSHLDHKGAAIDTILAAQPDQTAILLGDSGQKDAEVYRDAVKRHPGRIAAVALREPAPGVGADDAAALAEIEAMGLPALHAASFDGMTDRLRGILARPALAG
jgi:phosphatidate phosphatase APP1